MRKYLQRKAAAIFVNNQPTMTDQSGARETDINIIVGKMGITGALAQAQGEPTYGDFSDFPADLRETIELARGLNAQRAKLPEQLRDKPIEELMALTRDDITRILTPAQTPATPPGSDKETK